MSTHQVNRIQNGHGQAAVESDWQGQIDECQQAILNSVKENPLAATLFVFGVGFSIGTAIGSLLSNPREQRRQHLAKALGRRMLNSVHDYLPDRLHIS